MEFDQGLSLISILVVLLIAIFTIRKTAEENRVSNIHAELCACLVDTVSLIDDLLSLLDGIANHIVYQTVPEEQILETAYSRYWREIGPLSKRFKDIQAKQRLVFPKKLYDHIQDIVKKVNDARGLARHAAPNEDHIYPDTRELRKVVDEAASAYRNLLHESRKYLGTDRIAPITMISELPLKAKEDKKPTAHFS